MKLLHPKLNEVNGTGIFNSDFCTIEQFMQAIEDKAAIFVDDDLKWKFKGDCLEILAEFFFKTHELDKRAGITDYRVNYNKDYGVDGYGVGIDGTPAATQVKYRQAHQQLQMNKEKLSNFFDQATNKYEFNVTNYHNLVIFTTGKDVHHTYRDRHPGLKVIAINQLKEMLNGVIPFWNNFKFAITHSIAELHNRHYHTPKVHQVRILRKIQEFLDNPTETRGQIIAPTGSGKTLVELKTAEYVISKQRSIIIVTVPRLILLQQILEDFFGQKQEDWNFMKVGSGEIEREDMEEYAEDYNYMNWPASTGVNQIKEEINRAARENKSLIFFSTYHSVDKIGSALRSYGLEAELLLADEAHNTVGGFQDVLFNRNVPVKQRLFFTATRKVSSSNTGSGMNNPEKFGRIIESISAAELSRLGEICFPRIHFAKLNNRIADTVTYEGSNTQTRDFVKIIASAFHYHKQRNEEFKMIVACQSAEQAHVLAEDTNLNVIFQDTYIQALTTHNRMDMSISRKSIFNNYEQSNYSILFHYRILSEGIDLPGTNGILSLRNLEQIATLQFIGRALRLHPEDRAKLFNNEINAWKDDNDNWIDGWKKPFGYVIIPQIEGTELEDWREKTKKIVNNLRANFGYMLEELIETDESTGGKTEDVEFDTEDLDNDSTRRTIMVNNYDTDVLNVLEELDDIIPESFLVNDGEEW